LIIFHPILKINQEIMSKKIAVFLSAAVILAMGIGVGAQEISVVTIPNPLKTDSFIGFVSKIIDFIFIIALILAPLMLMIAAWYWVTAGAKIEADAIKKGKEIFWYVILGLILLMLAKGIIMAINQAFGLK